VKGSDEMTRALNREMKRKDEERSAESAEHISLEAYFAGLDAKPVKKVKRAGPKPVGRKWLSLVYTFLLTALIVLLIRHFVLQHNTVIGTSMLPTLEDRDEIFVEKISRLFPSGLKRGSIVIVATRERLANGGREYIIKRIIGLPGERVTLKEGAVWIDGQKLDEAYLDDWVLTDARVAEYADLILGPDQFYLMGDNRPNSRDSRDVGPFSQKDIIGSLILRFFPFDRVGKPK